MKNIVQQLYLVLYKNDSNITFVEKLIISSITLFILMLTLIYIIN